MADVGLICKGKKGYTYSSLTVSKFLKNIFGLDPHLQNTLFNVFMETLIAMKKELMSQDDFGVLDLGAVDSVIKTFDVFKLKTGKLDLKLSRIHLARGVSWKQINKKSPGHFYKSSVLIIVYSLFTFIFLSHFF
jgi:hypothetical protein